LGESWFDLAEKQKSLHSLDYFSFLTEECFWVDYFCIRLIEKFPTSTNLFQNLWSNRSIWNIQIATDCSVFDRFCFLCVVCLFWWFYGFIWWVFAIEKLEYSRYNAKTKYEYVFYSNYSSGLLSYTNWSHEGFVGVLCDWSFQVLGYLTMDEGISIRKRLS